MCFPLEVFVTGNALVLMPDYMGYGITKNSIHPYLNHELCAINSVDAFPAGYAVFEQLSDKGYFNYYINSNGTHGYLCYVDGRHIYGRFIII